MHVATHVGLTFTATVGHLCTAIRKLAAVTSPQEVETPLFRAVRGELPRSFWIEDKQGMVCAVDAGFMSTSRNRETPVYYMAGKHNVLWEISPTGESDMAYHRGASVGMLSQFPGEEEVLFPPCSMLVVLKGKRAPPCHESAGSPAAPEEGEEQQLHARRSLPKWPSTARLLPGLGSDARPKAGEQIHSAQNSKGELVAFQAINVMPFFI